MELKYFRVFKESVGWADGLFIIDKNIDYKSIKNNPPTSFLCRKNFLGLYKFDVNFLEHLQSMEINGYKIYFEYLWEKFRIPYAEKID